MKCKVIGKENTENYLFLSVETSEIINVLPGQFFMVKTEDYDFPKPFSVIFQKGKVIEFLIAVVGDLTGRLKKLKIGDFIDIRGPYGKSFIETIDKNKKYILIGGDCGSAPLMHFKNEYPELVENEYYGFRTNEIKSILDTDKLHIDEEEGISVIERIKRENPSKNTGFLVCGSLNMIKAVKNEFKGYKVYASLEARMGCGVGMCKGCPIKTKDGIKMICKDGPVFDLSEVDLEW
ncbi:2-polyprenylphenol hydroxylase-like oxidoreductase [Marinitoga piezophila KA3]|uniref:2-polyprenylphenol hydroxylase-like oxidoreductase n=2 Tax=Marinitoga TaxID=160798 RepID=H2J4G4_MARPK|nr:MULTISPECIES: FAD-binding oxidoreductase [Marinitoga]AEX84819.1 2-polyprenylphenol hydroxylase-like oxidoreductase [Marinitoga piezophila KA3]APT75329.1 hypothetical protein LN42_02190 [Marinitoga sp. 1137]NUU97015.1 hypothetical protein [Marinitoga sp. 1138]